MKQISEWGSRMFYYAWRRSLGLRRWRWVRLWLKQSDPAAQWDVEARLPGLRARVTAAIEAEKQTP